ncbi:MAG: glycosyltransferase family 39 protein [Candidatus Krumholzibacteriota bacterium]|nr:glycosyltransferase family 39 protein [Candidatus Krumholzibacteriota bacterium]
MNPDNAKKASPPKTSRNALFLIQERFDHLFPLLYVLLFTLTVGVIHLSSPAIGDLGVESDFFSELVVSAQKLWQGDFSVDNYPFKGPFFSFALVFVHVFGGDWYTNNIILNLICAGLSLIVIYRLFLRIYSRSVAVAAVLLLSANYEFFYHAHKASSDMLFFLLAFLSLHLLVREKRSWYYILAGGLVGGLAFLTRYNGFFIPVSGAIMFIFVNPGKWKINRRLLAGTIFLGAFLLPCLPWFWANHSQTGSILTTHNLYNIVQEFYGGARESEIPPGGFTSIYHLITHDTGYFLAHYGKNIFSHLFLDLRKTVGQLVGIFVFFGLLQLFFIPPSRRQKSFLIFPLFYYLSMCAIFYLPRLSLPIVPAYYALGLSFLFGSGNRHRSSLGKWTEGKFTTSLEWINRPLGRKKDTPPPSGRISGRAAAARKKGGGAEFSGAGAPGAKGYPSPRMIIGLLVMAGLLVAEIAMIVSAERYYRRQNPLYIMEVARFLKSHQDPDSTPVILARKGHLAYYAGMRYQNYPQNWNNFREFIDYALDHQVRYIAYGDIERMYFSADEFMRQLPQNEGIDLIYEDSHALIFSLAEWMPEGRVIPGMQEEDFTNLLGEAERSRDPERIMYTCKNIASLHITGGDWNAGIGYFTRGMEIIRSLPDNPSSRENLSAIRNYLSQSYLETGRYREGIQLQQENIELFKRSGDMEALARSHLLTYRHFEMLKEIDKAREHLEISRNLYLGLGNRKMARSIDQILSRLGNQPGRDTD